ncbi:hypothetical protein H696_02226 [Fonticula alba]|uniref:Uncharacterized protein n=1 Tax=Fonticula alba TaxID=691883 RepID=A0A058ZBI0_FONAL|nr:hypothetical protein H696_02226 [Fonticula alba]KCV71278.1 hypothetical protein H696_02226 [Fonticula alba]|eukprot:XP_009494401.1 hypothetical protein H696_02226 [Fonticula alba]
MTSGATFPLHVTRPDEQGLYRLPAVGTTPYDALTSLVSWRPVRVRPPTDLSSYDAPYPGDNHLFIIHVQPEQAPFPHTDCDPAVGAFTVLHVDPNTGRPERIPAPSHSTGCPLGGQTAEASAPVTGPCFLCVALATGPRSGPRTTQSGQSLVEEEEQALLWVRASCLALQYQYARADFPTLLQYPEVATLLGVGDLLASAPGADPDQSCTLWQLFTLSLRLKFSIKRVFAVLGLFTSASIFPQPDIGVPLAMAHVLVAIKVSRLATLPTGHPIYQVNDSMWISIPLSTIPPGAYSELEAEKLMQRRIAQRHYYCHGVDLTTPFPPTPTGAGRRPCRNPGFRANHLLSGPFAMAGAPEVCVALIRGTVNLRQETIRAQGPAEEAASGLRPALEHITLLVLTRLADDLLAKALPLSCGLLLSRSSPTTFVKSLLTAGPGGHPGAGGMAGNGAHAAGIGVHPGPGLATDANASPQMAGFIGLRRSSQFQTLSGAGSASTPAGSPGLIPGSPAPGMAPGGPGPDAALAAGPDRADRFGDIQSSTQLCAREGEVQAIAWTGQSPQRPGPGASISDACQRVRFSASVARAGTPPAAIRLVPNQTRDPHERPYHLILGNRGSAGFEEDFLHLEVPHNLASSGPSLSSDFAHALAYFSLLSTETLGAFSSDRRQEVILLDVAYQYDLSYLLKSLCRMARSSRSLPILSHFSREEYHLQQMDQASYARRMTHGVLNVPGLAPGRSGPASPAATVERIISRQQTVMRLAHLTPFPPLADALRHSFMLDAAAEHLLSPAAAAGGLMARALCDTMEGFVHALASAIRSPSLRNKVPCVRGSEAVVGRFFLAQTPLRSPGEDDMEEDPATAGGPGRAPGPAAAQLSLPQATLAEEAAGPLRRPGRRQMAGAGARSPLGPGMEKPADTPPTRACPPPGLPLVPGARRGLGSGQIAEQEPPAGMEADDDVGPDDFDDDDDDEDAGAVDDEEDATGHRGPGRTPASVDARVSHPASSLLPSPPEVRAAWRSDGAGPLMAAMSPDNTRADWPAALSGSGTPLPAASALVRGLAPHGTVAMPVSQPGITEYDFDNQHVQSSDDEPADWGFADIEGHLQQMHAALEGEQSQRLVAFAPELGLGAAVSKRPATGAGGALPGSGSHPRMVPLLPVPLLVEEPTSGGQCPFAVEMGFAPPLGALPAIRRLVDLTSPQAPVDWFTWDRPALALTFAIMAPLCRPLRLNLVLPADGRGAPRRLDVLVSETLGSRAAWRVICDRVPLAAPDCSVESESDQESGRPRAPDASSADSGYLLVSRCRKHRAGPGARVARGGSPRLATLNGMSMATPSPSLVLAPGRSPLLAIADPEDDPSLSGLAQGLGPGGDFHRVTSLEAREALQSVDRRGDNDGDDRGHAGHGMAEEEAEAEEEECSGCSSQSEGEGEEDDLPDPARGDDPRRGASFRSLGQTDSGLAGPSVSRRGSMRYSSRRASAYCHRDCHGAESETQAASLHPDPHGDDPHGRPESQALPLQPHQQQQYIELSFDLVDMHQAGRPTGLSHMFAGSNFGAGSATDTDSDADTAAGTNPTDGSSTVGGSAWLTGRGSGRRLPRARFLRIVLYRDDFVDAESAAVMGPAFGVGSAALCHRPGPMRLGRVSLLADVPDAARQQARLVGWRGHLRERLVDGALAAAQGRLLAAVFGTPGPDGKSREDRSGNTPAEAQTLPGDQLVLGAPDSDAPTPEQQLRRYCALLRESLERHEPELRRRGVPRPVGIGRRRRAPCPRAAILRRLVQMDTALHFEETSIYQKLDPLARRRLVATAAHWLTMELLLAQCAVATVPSPMPAWWQPAGIREALDPARVRHLHSPLRLAAGITAGISPDDGGGPGVAVCCACGSRLPPGPVTGPAATAANVGVGVGGLVPSPEGRPICLLRGPLPAGNGLACGACQSLLQRQKTHTESIGLIQSSMPMLTHDRESADAAAGRRLCRVAAVASSPAAMPLFAAACLGGSRLSRAPDDLTIKSGGPNAMTTGGLAALSPNAGACIPLRSPLLTDSPLMDCLGSQHTGHTAELSDLSQAGGLAVPLDAVLAPWCREADRADMAPGRRLDWAATPPIRHLWVPHGRESTVAVVLAHGLTAGCPARLRLCLATVPGLLAPGCPAVELTLSAWLADPLASAGDSQPVPLALNVLRRLVPGAADMVNTDPHGGRGLTLGWVDVPLTREPGPVAPGSVLIFRLVLDQPAAQGLLGVADLLIEQDSPEADDDEEAAHLVPAGSEPDSPVVLSAAEVAAAVVADQASIVTRAAGRPRCRLLTRRVPLRPCSEAARRLATPQAGRLVLVLTSLASFGAPAGGSAALADLLETEASGHGPLGHLEAGQSGVAGAAVPGTGAPVAGAPTPAAHPTGQSFLSRIFSRSAPASGGEPAGSERGGAPPPDGAPGDAVASHVMGLGGSRDSLAAPPRPAIGLRLRGITLPRELAVHTRLLRVTLVLGSGLTCVVGEFALPLVAVSGRSALEDRLYLSLLTPLHPEGVFFAEGRGPGSGAALVLESADPAPGVAAAVAWRDGSLSQLPFQAVGQIIYQSEGSWLRQLSADRRSAAARAANAAAAADQGDARPFSRILSFFD